MTNPVVDFFAWWNDAMADPSLLTDSGFARHFAPEGRLVVNGAERATGASALATHYRAIRDRHGAVSMDLPVDNGLADAETAFVHCHTRLPDGTRQEAMACASLAADGRIALLRVVQAG